MILCHVDNEQQYQQYLGRSSRTRGLCIGALYLESKLNSETVLRNMKSKNQTKLFELEKLTKLIWQKRNHKGLCEAILNA